MKTKADRLNEAIENMTSVCSTGKTQIRALVEVITAEDLSPKEIAPTYHIGSRFRFGGNDYILAVSGHNPKRVVPVNLRTGSRRGGMASETVGTVVDDWHKITEKEVARAFVCSYGDPDRFRRAVVAIP